MEDEPRGPSRQTRNELLAYTFLQVFGVSLLVEWLHGWLPASSHLFWAKASSPKLGCGNARALLYIVITAMICTQTSLLCCILLLGSVSSAAGSFCDQICTDITGTWVNSDLVPQNNQGTTTVTFHSDGIAYYEAELADTEYCPMSGYADYEVYFSNGHPALRYTVTSCEYECSIDCDCPSNYCHFSDYSYDHEIKFYDDCDYFEAESEWRLVEEGSGSGRNPCLIITAVFGSAALVCCLATILLVGVCVAWRRRKGKKLARSGTSTTMVMPISGYYLEKGFYNERVIPGQTEGSRLLPYYPSQSPQSSAVQL